MLKELIIKRRNKNKKNAKNDFQGFAGAEQRKEIKKDIDGQKSMIDKADKSFDTASFIKELKKKRKFY